MNKINKEKYYYLRKMFREGRIKDVYEENIVDEFRKISELIEEFNYVSMVKFYLSSGHRVPGNPSLLPSLQDSRKETEGLYFTHG